MKKLSGRALYKTLESEKRQISAGRDANSIIYGNGIRDKYCQYMLRAKADLYSWRHSVRHRTLCNGILHRKLIYRLKKERQESIEKRLMASIYDMSNQ